MTEREYKIEVLCTCYSLETLKEQLEKLRAGIAQNGPGIINDVDIMELDEAISSYDEERYRLIREELDREKESLIPNTYREYTLVLRKLLTDHYNFPIP